MIFGGLESSMLKLIKYDFEMVNTKIFSIFYKNAISEGNLFIYLK